MASKEGEGDFDVYFKNSSADPILWVNSGGFEYAWGPQSSGGGSLLNPVDGTMSGPARWVDGAQSGYASYTFTSRDGQSGLIEITFNLLRVKPTAGTFVPNIVNANSWTDVVVRTITQASQNYTVKTGKDAADPGRSFIEIDYLGSG